MVEVEADRRVHQKLKLSPPVTLTEEDWDAITDSRKLLNSQEELGPEEFETMILTQMSNYVHRKVEGGEGDGTGRGEGGEGRRRG